MRRPNTISARRGSCRIRTSVNVRPSRNPVAAVLTRRALLRSGALGGASLAVGVTAAPAARRRPVKSDPGVVWDGGLLDAPPLGSVTGASSIDYLQPAGIYRDVTLRVVPDAYI